MCDWKRINYLSTFFCCLTKSIISKQVSKVVSNFLAGRGFISMETREAIYFFERRWRKTIRTRRTCYCWFIDWKFRGRSLDIINCESTPTMVWYWTISESLEHPIGVEGEEFSCYHPNWSVWKEYYQIYLVGSTTFMKANCVGDREMYYLHCLRFYIPKLARETWERHQCGIGIYSMQGFERRNKESKSIMNKFNNNKQHRIPQQLRRL